MKKFQLINYALGLAAIMLLAYACNDRLDITRTYGFDLEVMPVQKKIVLNQTAEIRCQLVRQGHYVGTTYSIRYFQPDGKGELRLETGTPLKPNDLYPLPDDAFRLYYKSLGNDQQMIDVYIVDNFGTVIKKSFSFNSEAEQKAQQNDVY